MSLDDTTTTLTKIQEAEFRLHPARVHNELYMMTYRDGRRDTEPCERRVYLRTIGDVAFLTCHEHGHVLFEDTELYRD